MADSQKRPMSKDIPYSVVRSRRRTVALVVTADARLIVRAPRRTSNAYIERLIREKSGWIEKKIGQMESERRPPRKFAAGESFMFLGREYPLGISPAPEGDSIEKEGAITIDQSQPDIRRAIIVWYVEQAERLLRRRCAELAEKTGYRPLSVRISAARSRWGSCNRSGKVNISWRLIMAPWPVIDAVIIHELVHLEVKNHSRHFWERVGAIVPDYRQRMEWLKRHRIQLFF